MNPDESEMNPGTSILFTGLESQMENTDSVNELRSCSVISPCLFIVGSKDDRKTKYTAMSCQISCCKTCNYRLARVCLMCEPARHASPASHHFNVKNQINNELSNCSEYRSNIQRHVCQSRFQSPRVFWSAPRHGALE